MFDVDWGGYDEDVPGGTGFRYNHNDLYDGHCSGNDTGKEGSMEKVKIVEIVLLALSALVTSAMYVVKFIKQVDKLQVTKE